jgi:hypothetical protein
MKLIIKSVAVALVVVSSSALAASPFSRSLRLWSGSEAVQSAKQKRKIGKVDGCVDLSGSWVGRCTDDGGDWSEAVTFEQNGCESVYVGGTNAPIGGHFSHNVTETDGFVGTSSVFPSWNPNMTALRIRQAGHFRLMGSDLFMSGSSTGEYFLMDGKLVYRDNGEWRTELNGTLSVQETWLECTYTKQN